ncbi:hypothetical protein BpHYR1_050862 [Brachionus plicatilis]|uniref:Uncharacterized protein n=1 Tax=Brachionus plicatilis TaxID=10195 RepID=A0A3M7S4V8_BRAPC|nr:hypothetical protein BpHYR1_050862 [Brachionus plicatilis]
MIDVFQALATLPSRRDKLKSSIISINEFLGPDAASFFNLFKAIIDSFKQIGSLKLHWLFFLKKSELEFSISKSFSVYLSMEAFSSNLIYCEGTFSDIHYLRI